MQNFASFNRIATGIYGNDSKAIFEVEGSGKDQWVSFYHQSQPSPVCNSLPSSHANSPSRH